MSDRFVLWKRQDLVRTRGTGRPEERDHWEEKGVAADAVSAVLMLLRPLGVCFWETPN